MEIIVVDDDVLSLGFINSIFEKIGFKHKCFKDPVKAVKYILKNIDNIDIVISDYQMPKRTGVEIYDQIKKFKEIKFLLMSSSINDYNELRFIKKPLIYNDFKNLIFDLKK